MVKRLVNITRLAETKRIVWGVKVSQRKPESKGGASMRSKKFRNGTRRNKKNHRTRDWFEIMYGTYGANTTKEIFAGKRRTL